MSKLVLNKGPRNTLLIVAIATIAAFALNYIIREGERIKQENELLAYEVW